MQEWDAQMAEYVARRDAAMAAVNVKAGDRVEYHNVSPFGSAKVLTGVVYIASNGQPKVKVNGGRAQAWHKGWKA